MELVCPQTKKHADPIKKQLFCYRSLGGSESARTEHPNREVVSSRPCVRARSVIHVKSGLKWVGTALPFSLLGTGVFISLFPSGFVSWSLSEQVWANLNESERIWMSLWASERIWSKTEWIWVDSSSAERIWTYLSEIKWIWMRLCEILWIWFNLCETA